MADLEAELREAIQRVLDSPSRRKLVVAGPGTGKTTLFKRLLEQAEGEPTGRLVLTFINNLRNDLEGALGDLASVNTLHSYCMGQLHAKPGLRMGLTAGFRCVPGLGDVIRQDWEFIRGSPAPQFVRQMRSLEAGDTVDFYLRRGNYYDAVDFDDSVYRVWRGASGNVELLETYSLLLIDEYQDFNALEAGVIELLATKSPILVAGDDDQALYSHLRDSSWDHIRSLRNGGDFKVFELPFCMRCTRVIVDAVNDVLGQATRQAKLEGRIEKPYKHFPPTKGTDSQNYPTIARVQTSVQRANANYMARYAAMVAAQIPSDEIREANEGSFPVLLVIVAKPYRTQIIEYLDKSGFDVDTKRDSTTVLSREDGISILKEDIGSNVGWRVLLAFESDAFARDAIRSSQDGQAKLLDLIPVEFRNATLQEVEAWEPLVLEEPEAAPGETKDARVTIRVTSFEGAKGLSAQHVVIAGLHDGELPRDPDQIQDIEICRFLVGLTRTRKRCYLVYTRRFADQMKRPSVFLGWIDNSRYERITVDAGYWKQ